MAGSSLRIDFDYEENITAALQDLLAAESDLTEPYANMGEALLISHDNRFTQEVAPDGTPWVPLDPEYAAHKSSKRPSAGILVFDNFLRAGLSYDARPDALEFGSNRIYAATQHFGDAARGIPARPHIGMSPADREESLAILREFLEDAVV